MTPDTVHLPQRIQRRRTKGWRMPEGAVYVGRPTEWGNPWVVGEPLGLEWTDHAVGDGSRFFREVTITAELAVALYRIAYSPDADEIRATFEGRDLACFCPLNQPCHADVLLDIANGASS
jgi:hypothetical protein